jgi:hypothetical protein
MNDAIRQASALAAKHAAESADPSSKIRVVAAAARFRFDGELVHDQARELILSVPAPGRHHNVLYLAHRLGFEDSDIRQFEHGFLLSDGTFATRERAHEVATEAGQIVRRCGGDHHTLFSENLW